MRTNLKAKGEALRTHEGAPAVRIDAEKQLRRSVLACMLYESEFYEDGETIADRIAKTARLVSPQTVADLAVEAREKQNLRHAPLLLLTVLAQTGRGSRLVSDTIARVIQRADELSEFLAIYAKVNGVGTDKVKSKLSAQVKKGLARAFTKFDAYQLGKYNRDNTIKLRDVLFLSHAKPVTEEHKLTWAALIEGNLAAPDTWEVALSGGADKKETFERLLREEKLGYLALLRNLRNMDQAGVDPALVEAAIDARKGAWRVLPFRFVAAAKAAPRFEPALDRALLASLADRPVLPGKTIVLVDVSGSMDWPVSDKSQMHRTEAAATLAAMFPGESVRVFSFSDRTVEVPRRLGMAGVDAIVSSQPHSGTMLGEAVAKANGVGYDRLVVVTDEQSHDRVLNPLRGARGYMINVASAQNGVGYGAWTHMDGFSERVFDYMLEVEKQQE